MARSLAFWVENGAPQEGKEIAVELHFNFWSLQKDKINYLDIGVRLSDINTFDSINFYLPFDHKKINYDPELGKTICSSESLVSAIFNCPVKKLEPDNNQGFCDISFTRIEKERPIRFFTRLLAENSDSPTNGVTILPESDTENKGCRVSFPSKLFKISQNLDSYFRFRISLNGEEENSILTRHDPAWSIIANYFVVSDIIDFRVNESRNLPDKVKSDLTDNSCLRKVHFFLIRDTFSEYKMSHTAYFRCRILESDLWDDYLNIKNKNKKQMLIYHWKESGKENKIDHFSAFAKFSEQKIGAPEILIVLIIVMILGTLSGILSICLWEKLV